MITSVALFMTQLDNLVVSTALPVIRVDLHASLSALEWMVDAYTLTFAVLLLTGATLGERFGRRGRMFVIGLAIFTAASAGAAMAPSTGLADRRASDPGAGAAIVTPLTLTLLSAAVPVELAAAPRLVPGVRSRGSRSPSARSSAARSCRAPPGRRSSGSMCRSASCCSRSPGCGLEESGMATASKLDVPGVLLVSTGLFGVVLGMVRANELGWTSSYVLTALIGGATLVAAFIRWELRTDEPMLPMRLFRSRGFSAANGASVLMFFGMFGAIFLLSQSLQTMQGYTPLQAGVRMLPWTGMPIIIAPIAGILADRIGARPRRVRRAGAARRSGWPGLRSS